MAAENPRIVDQSTLSGVFVADTFLRIGVEGYMAVDGDATAGVPEVVSTAQEAADAFGVTSSLTQLVQFILSRGVNAVTAVASDATADPELDGRQAAWEALADDPGVRVRLTDSTTQADQVALAASCEAAESIDNKQFCLLAMATPSSKATLSSLAAAVASKRGVVVGPGVYNTAGTLLGGATLSALVAAEIAKNPDISDSLNTYEIPATAGIEKEAATGLPLFRLRSNGGTPLDDFQDLLDDGISPIQQAASGLAAFTHLRTTWTDDDTFDALQTLLIKDEVFLGIRDNLRANNMLRLPNNSDNRTLAAALTDAYLKSHDDWVEPTLLPTGTTGYGVTTQTFPDNSGFTLFYNGEVVRGTNRINIAGTLQIPV